MGIISALEAQKNFITYVKPAPDNKQNSIFYDLASTLKQTRICHLNLYEFMTSYTPRLVILDTASTPMLDVMHLDIDIIVFSDPFFPFFPECEKLLEKRVFIVDNLENFNRYLAMWENDTLPKLRDTTFYEKYVCTPDTDRKSVV